MKTTQDIVWQVREAEGESITQSSHIAERFSHLSSRCREEFHLVTMNQKNQIIDTYLISIGSLTASLVHPREVFKPAIMDSAAAIMFVHNHPSGDPTPSSSDKQITKRLKECGDLLGIRVLDHIIVGKDCYKSDCDGDF